MPASKNQADSRSQKTNVKPKKSRAALPLREMANAIRILTIDAVARAQSGHMGLPLGAADIATVLYTKFLKIDPLAPDWHDRDRFVLSAGHGSMLQYALHYLVGFKGMEIDDIKNFRKLESKTPGHPEYGHTEGIETTTGPLGQGLAHAVGMALAERMLNARYCDALVDHYTYVLASDGDMMEGISHEAISIAGHFKLSRLIILYDDNGITIDGALTLSESGDALARFKAAGFDVASVDGHNHAAIEEAVRNARQTSTPSLIACKTIIGYGMPKAGGTAAAHGAVLDAKELAATRKALGWSGEEFTIPADILDAWRLVGRAHVSERKQWERRMREAPAQLRDSFKRVNEGGLPAHLGKVVDICKQQLAEQNPEWATRKASEFVLDALVPAMPEMIGGSADLTGSNNTRTSTQTSISAEDFSGSFIHWGIREHAMAAAMGGMALHGGFIPYGGTFLVFSDYARPSIRLAALMRQRVIYVFTHDSIGVGEDGPTHQPVEHLAALRAMPNLNVCRPADAIETLECWQLALESPQTPSALILTRQNVPPVRGYSETNLCSRGAYELIADNDAAVALLASGSEVAIAIAARNILAKNKIAARVVSMPCMELFALQTTEIQHTILGDTPIRVAIEAAIQQSWDRWLRPEDIFIGMESFGASAPVKTLFKHVNITADAVARAAKMALKKQ